VTSTSDISYQWPGEGRVQFTDFRLRYGVGLPFVLDGVTFNIKPLEKIGVVGRTGGGLSQCFAQFREFKPKKLFE